MVTGGFDGTVTIYKSTIRFEDFEWTPYFWNRSHAAMITHCRWKLILFSCFRHRTTNLCTSVYGLVIVLSWRGVTTVFWFFGTFRANFFCFHSISDQIFPSSAHILWGTQLLSYRDLALMLGFHQSVSLRVQKARNHAFASFLWYPSAVFCFMR